MVVGCVRDRSGNPTAAIWLRCLSESYDFEVVWLFLMKLNGSEELQRKARPEERGARPKQSE